MTGWINWYEDKIDCPHCKKQITVLFYERANSDSDQNTKKGLVENTICPECKRLILNNEIE
ncbi:MAG: hypothetical protein Kow0098_09740 [Ignavibacteriaceae bacterium]